MRWYMDTHKYMSNITRKALQVLAERGITSESEPEEIDAAERALADAGVYKNYEGAKGRIRRALFTYFRAYDCMDANEGLTEIGRAYVDNKLSVQEISFLYVANFFYKDEGVSYYPLQLLLKFVTSISSQPDAYISALDFSRLVECNSIEDIDSQFVEELLKARTDTPPEINERGIGYDVWAKMLSQAGILSFEDHKLVLRNKKLADWILRAYEKPLSTQKGLIATGIIEHIPKIQPERPRGNPAVFADEGKALQGFLFDQVPDKIINKYLVSKEGIRIEDIRVALGLPDRFCGFYGEFSGIEHLVGHSLHRFGNDLQKTIGGILLNVEVTEVSELIEVEPIKTEYSIEDLGSILAEMYNSATATNKTAGIHMFGIKYGKVILDKGYPREEIVAKAGIAASYISEVNKGINLYKAIKGNEYGVKFYEESEELLTEPLPTLSPRTRKRFPLNCILYGAPGTGKTYATAQYALAIAENARIEDVSQELRSEVMNRYNKLIESGQILFTTFHQNYGYEDFIQGIRPDTSSKEMSFKTVDGVFKVIADRAMRDPDNDYVIIIDEINRANISKVFGELITLIEDDKRWGEENAINATLPSGEPFAVPNNLYIVGTMNSADKSISLIDTALRRRFMFIEYVPNLQLVSDDKLRKVLETLNKGIAAELNSTDLLVGHSYFMSKTEDDLCDIMNRNIIPLLYEYFFDNHKKVEAQIKKAIEGMDVEIESSSMGRIKLVKKGAE